MEAEAKAESESREEVQGEKGEKGQAWCESYVVVVKPGAWPGYDPWRGKKKQREKKAKKEKGRAALRR